MIGIHSVHRRLAELTEKAERLGGYNQLSLLEQLDITHCMKVNAKLVRRIDELKQLSFIAYEANDTEWQHELCKELDALEANLA
ncbi:hypothetical protein P9847_18535 [Paenibacillus chibensis]|uniref:Uncharacterized protein n=1 Tax=Paenibacillus chibensis TaxID=59846 RepID=A0ABU6PWN5_9BACL|nr:hypothetical protein [Paenibacillus chibensis]